MFIETDSNKRKDQNILFVHSNIYEYIYIHTYIHYPSKVFGHPEIILFPTLK